MVFLIIVGVWFWLVQVLVLLFLLMYLYLVGCVVCFDLVVVVLVIVIVFNSLFGLILFVISILWYCCNLCVCFLIFVCVWEFFLWCLLMIILSFLSIFFNVLRVYLCVCVCRVWILLRIFNVLFIVLVLNYNWWGGVWIIIECYFNFCNS